MSISEDRIADPGKFRIYAIYPISLHEYKPFSDDYESFDEARAIALEHNRIGRPERPVDAIYYVFDDTGTNLDLELPTAA